MHIVKKMGNAVALLLLNLNFPLVKWTIAMPTLGRRRIITGATKFVWLIQKPQKQWCPKRCNVFASSVAGIIRHSYP
jgi:hypothetical protein